MPSSKSTPSETVSFTDINNGISRWQPKLLLSWLMVGVLYLLSLLPMTIKQRVAELFGNVIYRIAKSRIRISQRNIEVCFPELSEHEQQTLIHKSTVSYAKGFFESLHCWWGDIRPFIDSLEVNGLQHLKNAQEKNRGVLLVGAHFTILDFAIPTIASQLKNPGYMYRANDNPVIDYMIERGRRRHYNLRAFNKYQSAEMIEFLKQGGEVWYAPDQDFGKKRTSIFATFFGVKTGCLATPSRIARESGAAVIQVSQFRHKDGHYKVNFRPLPDNFGENEQQDAEAWNQGLEQEIRKHPEQYLWVHKRFKTRPAGEPNFY